MLTAYFDESGVHEGNHLCVFAGYVGNDYQWTALAKDWIHALGSRRKNLHMSSIRNFKKVEKLLARLGPIPDKYRLQRIVSGVWWKDYNEVMKPEVRPNFTNPYMLAAQVCIVRALGCVERSEKIAIIFDRQDVHQHAVLALDEIVFKSMRVDPRISGITFSEARATVCLDPADYLAYEVGQYKWDKTSQKALAGLSILGDGKALGYIYTRDRLGEITAWFIQKGVAGQNATAHDLAELLRGLRSESIPTKHYPRSLFINLLDDC